jgi:hypothetical protein
MTYTCPSCGEIHDSWPALAFRAPDSYVQLSAEEKENMAFLNSDFCVNAHPFVHDYYAGITKAEAELRIQMMFNRGQNPN